MRSISTGEMFLFLFFSIFLFIELGYFLGKRFPSSENNNSALSIIKGAVLAMIGLLLGFSFAFSSNRFEQRRALMIHEANAIRTSYLQGNLMEEPLRSDYQQAIKNYLDERIQSAHIEATFNSKRWEQIKKNQTLQEKVWELGVHYAKEHPQFSNADTLIQQLSRMLELSVERGLSRLIPVPMAIIFLLIVSILIGGLLVGHSFGIEKQRSWLMTFIFVFLLSFVTLVILDLDQPEQGLLKEHQELYAYLRSTMN